MVRALALLYEATGGSAWRNHLKWLSGEPCVDGWFGVHCCPQALPVLRGDDECTADGGGATGVLTTQGSAACHSGSVTGTALDLATCVVVKVLLPSNNLIGSLDGALCELPSLQHLDLSGNALTGSLPSAADCWPRLTYLDLTQTRSWDDEGGVSGRVPEWLLDRLNFMAPLHLANNAFDDPTAAESAVAISRIWQRCQTLGAERCSGVPPIGCSAFNRQGQRYEVELDGLGCVRCPTPLEMGLVGCGIAFIVLLLMRLLGLYTRFMRDYPEHAKTHFATFMILVGHLQTLTIIGSMQLGWPLIIQEILASINLPFMSYIPCRAS
ncbi:leucine-rich repeat:na-ca exchanger integrin-beta4: ig [Chrysochromulina tobinii]|uniref:Leucine-rich repeat:na-ca exchanger integrin-beta4: ig n=1 Tax=Chrysochromulina tobinii TaxID=1460289 RepID=A0A0M0JDN1_9EUKA|nr:leucine-rich repeat:na-ca exchanger integrin-beta4: ig [Chrysochromulina tobinii]|eukprot:KOO24704.1 leucine-rich repeat:na-ca exchanger integrin-beta4: ig [Chrysochromulina sp. CCMP291]